MGTSSAPHETCTRSPTLAVGQRCLVAELFPRAFEVLKGCSRYVPLTGQHMLLVVHLIRRALCFKNQRADVMRQSRRLRCTVIAVQ